ncbi:PKD domain-containing protein [Mariniphaga sediminis]|uniref:PKD domain-containing protein n=1 Tax=Mariniphaga sediminis TaxID=1628158 RepID=A0A399D5E2_9BACT|nr:PKD domain-containing protein [Mariniphaga sediminis]RIH66869.1 PKD domain-containing protein [Mariniphaga sediminis]
MKKLLLRVFAVLLLVTLFQTCNEPYDSSVGPLQWEQPPGLAIAVEKVQSVVNLQDKISNALFRNPEVVGMGTGLNDDGVPAIVIYTRSKVEHRPDISIENVGRGARPTALPVSVENVPVVSKVTGMFKAYAEPTSWFPRPVPIGVSTGHPDITAGTIGCRVKDAEGNVFALSNNHVYANRNEASIGDNVLQPGPYDGGSDPADAIGTLYDFEPISFSENNLMDAAIALCSTGTLGTSTPADAYGTPGSTTVSAAIGLDVQKYGRTTGWTHGTISEINVTVDVCYQSRGPFKCVQAARFVDQITITPGDFSDGGDSGSLIVTDNSSNSPVGLLFAGSSTHTIATPIGVVLNRFGVTIDNESGGTVNTPPSAGFTYTTSGLTATFTDTSTDPGGSVVEWNWNFGDGNTSTEQNPGHTYNAGGTFSVLLEVTDNEGATGSSSQNVTVSENTGTGITLTAAGEKIRGVRYVNLSWEGAIGDNVVIKMNGSVYDTVSNDGSETLNLGRISGTFVFEVCESDGVTCSNEAAVTF